MIFTYSTAHNKLRTVNVTYGNKRNTQIHRESERKNLIILPIYPTCPRIYINKTKKKQTIFIYLLCLHKTRPNRSATENTTTCIISQRYLYREKNVNVKSFSNKTKNTWISFSHYFKTHTQ